MNSSWVWLDLHWRGICIVPKLRCCVRLACQVMCPSSTGLDHTIEEQLLRIPEGYTCQDTVEYMVAVKIVKVTRKSG